MTQVRAPSSGEFLCSFSRPEAGQGCRVTKLAVSTTEQAFAGDMPPLGERLDMTGDGQRATGHGNQHRGRENPDSPRVPLPVLLSLNALGCVLQS